MLAGSEGILGVITSAWVRVQPRPAHRASAGVRFETSPRGAECVRAISQSGLNPSNCRLLDAGEAELTMAGDGSHALLVLGFESTDHPVDDALTRALAICAEHGGAAQPRREGGGGDAVGSWRGRVPRRPLRARPARRARASSARRSRRRSRGSASRAFYERVMERGARGASARSAARAAASSAASPTSTPTARRPTSPCSRPARRGEEIEQWGAIKRAVSDVLIEQGATITHHHAVGRDHRPWYDRQRPDPFAAALRGAKAAVDPAGVMNPRRCSLRPAR